MPSPRALLPLALVLCACGQRGAPPREPGHADSAPPVAAAPEPVEPAPAASEPAPDAPAPAGERTAQQVTFDDDADPEPTTQVQGAPKRPPIPRFRLFGTREGDGPN